MIAEPWIGGPAWIVARFGICKVRHAPSAFVWRVIRDEFVMRIVELKERHVRPQAIINFERFYLAAWMAGLVASVLLWDKSSGAFAARYDYDSSGTLFVLVTAVGLLLPLVLWYLTAWRASGFARWIVICIFVIQMIGLVGAVLAGTLGSSVESLVALVAFVLRAVAVGWLFHPASRDWLATGRLPELSDMDRPE